jgi:hypothetical protein
LACSDLFLDGFAHIGDIFLAIVMKFMDLLREAVVALTYVVTFLLPTQNSVMATNAMPLKPNLLQSTSAPTIKAIVDTKALMACIVLGLLVIVVVNYLRSPWRKLPPGGPPRLPFLGNALQLKDKSWLLSKD